MTSRATRHVARETARRGNIRHSRVLLARACARNSATGETIKTRSEGSSDEIIPVFLLAFLLLFLLFFSSRSRLRADDGPENAYLGIVHLRHRGKIPVHRARGGNGFISRRKRMSVDNSLDRQLTGGTHSRWIDLSFRLLKLSYSRTAY